jgi:hypothetical protein
MPPLADLQRQMARALLHGTDTGMPPTAAAPVPADAAFGVYRDTVLSALATALRLTFPTVDRLVGEAFFDQAACAYAGEAPPRRARLAAYGESFPVFLQAYAPTQGLVYLSDVARLDWAIAQALLAPDHGVRRSLAIEETIFLALSVSLTVLDLRFSADLIRAALTDDDDPALAAIDLAPRPRCVAIWRDGRTAVVQPLSRPAGLFLAALLSRSTPDEALAAACAQASPQGALWAIQAEVFAARFAEITHIRSEEETP